MSATPEREQAEALDVVRDCYEQAVRKNWDSVNLATYDLRRALAAVSRLEAALEERPFIGGASLINERAEAAEARLAAAVERERELTRTFERLAGILDYGAEGFGCENKCEGCQHEMREASRIVAEALAGGVSAAGRPPEQDLGGNEVAVAEAGE